MTSLNEKFWQSAFHRFATKKRPTVEMTWGETASTQVEGNASDVDKKVAVSPSRPMICSAFCSSIKQIPPFILN